MNPNHKSLKTKYGKEVLFTPDSIVLTNNNGMSVKLDDNQGIIIESDQKIALQSNDAIEIVSKSGAVSIAGTSQVSLCQGSATVTLDDDISLSGAQIFMN